jgi:hypothetical protein
MARRGYYDKALSGARALGEIANLLSLFAVDTTQLERSMRTGVVENFQPSKFD